MKPFIKFLFSLVLVIVFISSFRTLYEYFAPDTNSVATIVDVWRPTHEVVLKSLPHPEEVGEMIPTELDVFRMRFGDDKVGVYAYGNQVTYIVDRAPYMFSASQSLTWHGDWPRRITASAYMSKGRALVYLSPASDDTFFYSFIFAAGITIAAALAIGIPCLLSGLFFGGWWFKKGQLI